MSATANGRSRNPFRGRLYEMREPGGIRRAFFATVTAKLGLIVLAIFVVTAIFGPIFFSEEARVLHSELRSPPSAEHLLGTDGLGRDIFYRILAGTRLSLVLAVSAAVLGLLGGFVIGAVSALLRGRPQAVLLRIIDVLQAFPTILIGIFIGAMLGPGPSSAVAGIGIAIAFHFARVASTLALSINARDYVTAAKVVGVSRVRVVARHIVPNLAETLLVAMGVAMTSSIVSVSALSFLGLGVQPPNFDWGRMLNEGVAVFYTQPAAALGPGVAIAISALTFGLLGEALAQGMNPRLWTTHLGHALPKRGSIAIDAPPVLRSDPVPVGAAGTGTVLEARDLTVSFPGPDGYTPVVSSVTFGIRRGEMVGIVGESGSGKTMTAMAAAQLLPPGAKVDGEIFLRGRDVQKMTGVGLNDFLNTELAVVFQDPGKSLNPALSVATQLTEAYVAHDRGSKAQAEALAEEKLREVNMASPSRVMTQYPHELSGGMRQRVLIAAGLINEPELLIADEPTTALDVTVQAQVMDVLAEINDEHEAAILLISHDLGLIAQNCSRVMVMYAGRIVEDAPTADILANPLHPYTKALLETIPTMSRSRDVRLRDIPGNPPNPAELPTGCSFHPRCPLATDKCRTEDPPLRAHAGGRLVACWAAEGEA